MTRTSWRVVLSLGTLLGLIDVARSDCVAEAAALATAEVQYEVADMAHEEAAEDFANDPNPTTAAALAVAEIQLELAQDALDIAQADYDECIGEPGEHPMPIPLVLDEDLPADDTPLEGVSVLVR